MPKFHRHHYGRFAHFGGSLSGAVWLIGLGILFMTGHWWPGILVLVGLSIIFSALQRPSAPSFPETDERAYMPPPSPAPIPPVVIMPTAPAPAPVHRADLLPATCLHCDGPIRASEVKWIGAQSAACPYCGSNLPMGKNGK